MNDSKQIIVEHGDLLIVEDGYNVALSVLKKGSIFQSKSIQMSHEQAKELNEFLTQILKDK